MAAMMEMDARDLSYEESVLRDPFALSHWLNYLEYKSGTDTCEQRWVIFERAVRVMPGSYKLWSKYIKERVSLCLPLSPAAPEWGEVNNLFERCLVHLHKMPVIWREYLAFLRPQYKLTRIRRTFDRMLASIAVTQHEKFVWREYLEWATTCGVAETGVRVFRRYLKVNPLAIEDFVHFLKKCGRLEEAATELTKIVNDDNFLSQRGKSKHDLWSELLRLLVRNPTKMSLSATIDVDAIIRSGIARFAHEVGRLWTNLADFYIRIGQFEKARDIYEESIHAVHTVRDFSLVFDAYAKFEESLLNAKMAEVADDEAAAAETNTTGEADTARYKSPYADDDLLLDWYSSHGVLSAASHPDLVDLDIDLSMHRLDHLLARRPLLLSSVILRQNPHHVAEWSNRVALFPSDPLQQIAVYTEAVQTIDPFQANNGKLDRLWVSFARFYEHHGDIENARVIFAKASQVNFKHVDSLTHIWTEWVEMELRHGQYDTALQTIRRALVVPTGLNRQNLGWSSSKDAAASSSSSSSSSLTCQQRIYKSTRLWSLYADLEENFGTLESTKAVYDQMFFLRIVTPSLALSYAQLMWQHHFFEDTFRIYEKAISVFSYPHVYPIWMCYLHQFISRYGGGTGAQRKIERIRDLFEQALKGLPIGAVETKKIYLLYAKYEEDHGLARRAMEIYSRACQAATPTDRYELYIVYLARCARRFGVSRTREIYETAIRHLPDVHVKAMSLKYARLERTLGEVDRARAIYAYASQFCDPRVDAAFWGVWSEFEVSHGNQDTFKEMLRLKRSVLAHFAANSIVAVAPHSTLTPENSLLQSSRAPGAKQRDEKRKERAAAAAAQAASEEAEAAEAAAAAAQREATAGHKRRRESEEDVGDVGGVAAADGANPEEINLDDLDDLEDGPVAIEEDEEDGEDDGVAVKSVPAAVFGLAAPNADK